MMAVISMGMTFTLAAFGLLFIASLDKEKVDPAVIGVARPPTARPGCWAR